MLIAFAWIRQAHRDVAESGVVQVQSPESLYCGAAVTAGGKMGMTGSRVAVNE